MTSEQKEKLLEQSLKYKMNHIDLGVDQNQIFNFIIIEIKEAIKNNDNDLIEALIDLVDSVENKETRADILNELLIIPGHKFHQPITKEIQSLANSSSIPYIKSVIESDFDYLEYTCSEDCVIAKWFSWALYSIGTEEAIDLIKKYSKSDNEGIREEMTYRLKMIK